MKLDRETAAPTEIELKFAIAPSDIPAFKALPRLGAALSAQKRLVATYYDTEDHALRSAGFALRLRRSGETVIQTLKGPALASTGLLARSELETPVKEDALDAGALLVGLPPDLYAGVSGRLKALFTVEVDRSEWLVHVGTALVVVSLDQGLISTSSSRAPISEVEIELRTGGIEAVFEIAREAAKALALHLEPLSKSERGYRLIGCPLLPKATKAPITAVMPAAEGIRHLAGTLLEDIHTQRKAVLDAGDAEAVHQLRVLLRRLRCLLDIASETLDTDGLARIEKAARRVFRRLGKVRDLDILAAAVPQNAEIADGAMLTIAAERRREMEKVRRLMTGRRYATSMLNLLAFAALDRPGHRHGADRLDHMIRPALARRWTAVQRCARPSSLRTKARHSLRIKAKTFRYATDFFGDLFVDDKAAKRRRKAEDAVRDMQTFLGRLNDRRNVARLSRSHLGSTVTEALGLSAASPDPTDLLGADKAFWRLISRTPYWA